MSSKDNYDHGVAVPARVRMSTAEVASRTGLPRAAVIVFAHLDPRALGVALGSVFGLWVFAATNILVAKGGAVVGPRLLLLSNYFIGYRVTFPGSIVGFVYASVIGFALGYLFARLRNLMLHLYLVYIRSRAEREAVSDLLDRII